MRLDHLRDAKRRVHSARERHRQQHQRGRVALQRGQRQPAQGVVDQIHRRGQRGGQRLEAGLAGGQTLAVAHELESRVDRVAQHVGQVVQVQRGQVASAVVHAQRPESPGHGVAAVLVHEHIQRREARPLGQEAAAGDAVRQRRVAPLQEGQHRGNGGVITAELPCKGLNPRGVQLRWLRLHAALHLNQPGRRQQFENQRQRQVFLHRLHTARTQETRQVGGGRVRCVQLRHRRDDGQHAGAGRWHAGQVGCQRFWGLAADGKVKPSSTITRCRACSNRLRAVPAKWVRCSCSAASAGLRDWQSAL